MRDGAAVLAGGVVMLIATERLILRPLDLAGDLASLHRIGLDRRVSRMMQSIAPDWTPGQAATFLERSRWRGQIGFRHAIALRSAPEILIGTIGIGGDPVSTAYFLDADHWGKGYATEALAGFLAAVMPRFAAHRVEAGHFADNPASGAVLRKVGFIETGRETGVSAARSEAAPVIDYRLDLARLKAGPLPVILDTARLHLRPVSLHDEAAVLAGLNDPGVSGWLAPVPYPYGRDDFIAFLEGVARAGESFAIDDGEGFAGVITCGRDLGYWLTPRAQGRGYATEAARAVLGLWFEAGGGDVVSGYFEGNLRSARVLGKLGFVETRRAQVFALATQSERPHVFLRLSARDFRQVAR